MELSEMFYTFVITTLGGICVLSLKLCYKSKCKKVSLCGISFERDLEIEMREDLAEMHKAEEKQSTL
jgi:hypothetical protein